MCIHEFRDSIIGKLKLRDVSEDFMFMAGHEVQW